MVWGLVLRVVCGSVFGTIEGLRVQASGLSLPYKFGIHTLNQS